MTDDEFDDMDEMLNDADAVAEIDDEDAPQEPPDGQVVFLNDDYTTADFVVQVLIEVFHKSETEAETLMHETDTKGSAVVGVYALDVALTRARLTMKKARDEGYPLQVQVLTLPAGSAGGGSK